MSRLISRFELRADQQAKGKLPPERGGPAGGEGDNGKTGQAKIYLDLIVKMIPAEVVTLYTFAIKLVPLIHQNTSSTGKTATAVIWSSWDILQIVVAWIIFGVSFVLTPVALSLEDEKPAESKWARARTVRLILASLAFPLWAYATSGEYLPGVPYNNALSLILVAIYAVIAGIIAKKVAPG
jgi:hypothetical protein